MNKDQMKDLVQRQLEAYNGRDLEKFCDCYHLDVVVMNLISDKTTCTGMNQFKKIYEDLFGTSPNLNCNLKSRIVLETTVIDEEWVTGIPRYPDGLHAVAIYGFRDGKIDRVWFPR